MPTDGRSQRTSVHQINGSAKELARHLTMLGHRARGDAVSADMGAVAGDDDPDHNSKR
jgi:hypothetical protein